MGLAWTSMGGNSLYVEAAGVEKAEGKGSLRTTGQHFWLALPCCPALLPCPAGVTSVTSQQSTTALWYFLHLSPILCAPNPMPSPSLPPTQLPVAPSTRVPLCVAMQTGVELSVSLVASCLCYCFQTCLKMGSKS